ncbi:hypothetical protein HUJ05_009151 [Dendroctonus ponderosae]|nr:hypothetical protein HUJ05_009151 [Dendroctonus ponderosae]
MGCFGSKDKLSKEDMDFLKSHTRYDESTIKEWYKGFKLFRNSESFGVTAKQHCVKDDSHWSALIVTLESHVIAGRNPCTH